MRTPNVWAWRVREPAWRATSKPTVRRVLVHQVGRYADPTMLVGSRAREPVRRVPPTATVRRVLARTFHGAAGPAVSAEAAPERVVCAPVPVHEMIVS